ncbi:MAG: tetratricopeptide repeat protein [Bacteroidetes bacterium]|nr:tetratricopeptide repeat protein [Bacteroidota bacterium]
MNREFAKGLAKVKENDFLTAIEHFSLAIQDDAGNVEYYAERAVAYLNTNQFDLSMFDMNRCIELDSNNSYRYSCRAFLKAKMGDTDGAIVDYEMAVKLDPDDAIAYNNLGLAQESKGFNAMAEKSYARSNELIGYNPKKFDEGEMTGKKTDQPTDKQPDQKETDEKVSGRSVAKGVFTSRSGFRDFLRFIRNGFKIKE